jgi:hypothetical protein
MRLIFMYSFATKRVRKEKKKALDPRYVPGAVRTPVSPVDSFSSPQWGGVIFCNPQGLVLLFWVPEYVSYL